MEILNNEYCEFVGNLIEKKLPILKKNEDFNKSYKRLSEAMEELEKTLSENQKEQFDEIVRLFYKTEEYYFTLAYYLGIKLGEDLNKL